jgi:hypothetical protein
MAVAAFLEMWRQPLITPPKCRADIAEIGNIQASQTIIALFF